MHLKNWMAGNADSCAAGVEASVFESSIQGGIQEVGWSGAVSVAAAVRE